MEVISLDIKKVNLCFVTAIDCSQSAFPCITSSTWQPWEVDRFDRCRFLPVDELLGLSGTSPRVTVSGWGAAGRGFPIPAQGSGCYPSLRTWGPSF